MLGGVIIPRYFYKCLRHVLEPPHDPLNHPHRPYAVTADSESETRSELSSNREIHLSLPGHPPDPVSIFMTYRYSITIAQHVIDSESVQSENVFLHQVQMNAISKLIFVIS